MRWLAADLCLQMGESGASSTTCGWWCDVSRSTEIFIKIEMRVLWIPFPKYVKILWTARCLLCARYQGTKKTITV